MYLTNSFWIFIFVLLDIWLFASFNSSLRRYITEVKSLVNALEFLTRITFKWITYKARSTKYFYFNVFTYFFSVIGQLYLTEFSEWAIRDPSGQVNCLIINSDTDQLRNYLNKIVIVTDCQIINECWMVCILSYLLLFILT